MMLLKQRVSGYWERTARTVTRRIEAMEPEVSPTGFPRCLVDG